MKNRLTSHSTVKQTIGGLLLAASLAVMPALRASLPSTTASNLTIVYPATAGTVTTGQSGSTLNITSTAPTTVLNWANFWDGSSNGGTSTSSDTIHYALPGSTSSILNNVSASGGQTQINGNITSNGRVFILNPSGIFIDNSSATIDTAGFYASTVSENLSYFEQNGTLQVFSGTPPAATPNHYIEVDNADITTVTQVGGGGDIRFAAQGVFLTGGTLRGNVWITEYPGYYTYDSYEAPLTIASTTVGGTTLGGNLTINSIAQGSATSGDTVYLTDNGFAMAVNGNLTITSHGGEVFPVYNGNLTVGGTTSINTVGASSNGSVLVSTGGVFTSGATTIVTGNGSSPTTDGSIELDQVNLGGAPISVTGGTTIIGQNVADTHTLTIGTSVISGSLELDAHAALTTQNFGSTSATPATVTMTSNTGNDIELVSNGAISFNGSGAENITTLSNNTATGAVNLTTTGNIALNTGGNIDVSSLSLTSGGTISEGTTTGIASSVSTTTVTVSAPTVTLNAAGNAITDVILKDGSGSGISLTDAASTLEIGNKTSTTGNVTIVNNGATLTGNSTAIVQLGDSASSVLSFGGTLSITANAGAVGVPVDEITTTSQNITTTGKTTLTTGTTAAVAGNSITFGGTPSATTAWNFGGAIYASTGNSGAITLGDNTGLVLGTVNTAGNLVAVTNLTGTGNSGISNPAGVVTAGGTTTLTAGTSATAASNIQVGGTANPAALTGSITIGAANNLSLTNSVATTIGATTAAVKGLTSITQTGAGAASAVSLGTLPLPGTTVSISNLSITDTGSSPTGSVVLNDATGVTLSNFAVGGVASTVTLDAAGPIVLGAGIADSNTGITTLTSTGSSAGISDTASSPVSIFGATVFNSDGAINVSNNTGNSLGGVSLNLTGSSPNNNNITYTEGGGVNLQAITVGSSYSGTVAITSVNSVILETAASVLGVPLTGKLTLTATSAGGAVTLNTAADNTIAAPVTITATGNSTIASNTNLLLNGVAITSGSFGATSTGGNITEATGTTIYSYANDSFTTSGGNISLNQSGNNFGALTINSDGGNVTVKEYGGNNYAAVNTDGGTLSATSEQSVIIETGNTGIQSEGTTLSAPHGSIALNATGNDFDNTAIVVTTTGNAALTDADAFGTTIIGGGTNVAGNLTVSNINPNGIIRDNGTTGNITVGGIGAFLVPTSGSGEINFTGANNSIASIELKAGTGSTVFFDNSSVAVVPGTVVSGAANISSGGSISITQSGPVTFASTLSLNANGNITVSNTSALFNQAVTAVVTGATSDVNFSALSLATNFNNVAPSVTTSNNAVYYQAPAP